MGKIQMNILDKFKLTIFINTLYSIGVIMFRLILIILTILILYYIFNGGLNIKINDQSYKFQIETRVIE